MDGRHESSKHIKERSEDHLREDKQEYSDYLKSEGLSPEEKKVLLSKINDIDTKLDLLAKASAADLKVFSSIDSFVQRSSGTEAAMEQNLRNIEASNTALLAAYNAEVAGMDKATMKSILEDMKTNCKKIADAVELANTEAAKDKSLTWDEWTMLGMTLATLIATIGIGIGIGLRPGSDTPEDAPSLDDLMEYIETIKSMLSSGKIAQDSVWLQIADYLDKDTSNKISIDSQVSALSLIQAGLVNLDETKNFDYADPATEIQPLLTKLHDAYNKENKLGDVYREAILLRYDNERIPFYHTSVLLQTSIAVIRYQLHHTNTSENAASGNSASFWAASAPKAVAEESVADASVALGL